MCLIPAEAAAVVEVEVVNTLVKQSLQHSRVPAERPVHRGRVRNAGRRLSIRPAASAGADPRDEPR